MVREESERVRIALQEHLGTGRYTGSFDYIVDLAVKRLGRGGIFTVTSTGDDRLASDRRYEALVDQTLQRYEREDIEDRGVLISDGEGVVATIYNSIEYETGQGHFVAFGMPRELDVKTGSDLTFEAQLAELKPHRPLVLVGHPTFIGGLAPTLKTALREAYDPLFHSIDGIAVYSGTANLIPGSNKAAIDLFRSVAAKYPHIAPFLENDGHSRRMEFARVSTSIPKPKVIRIAGTPDAEFAIDKIRESFRQLAKEGLEKTLKRNPVGIVDKTLGLIGAVRHAADLTLLHPRRIKREERQAAEAA